MRQYRSEMLPGQLKSTTLLINWDLELTKSILVEKIQKLKRYCLRELNQFIDNLIGVPLVGKFEDFLLKVDKVRTYPGLEQLVLHLIDFIDGTFENLIARGEQFIPDFNRVLPRFLNLPELREKMNASFVEEILPLFMSEYAVVSMLGSPK